ncbi:hypothetical protein HETIRDRAFT_127322 [Heterobasidion irregulare TC 32-1]|uniref:Alpha-ketoglutarate-dependent dioxygenase AlkB-like domain-containing protein n=1 Tax=Heterobasidion irregulare (strain TC 32-1) TaxID=747525 RepID=W4JXR6_HETIT|nr:uncharacterized protein HETIRDRAFT_127322 [Heterobasidion irregulare TC 32-1]ETW78318.1 hypothetical protein HETIRDRAFT_127322 [Heterobasidion irregulare TC 32-1]
MFFPKFLDLTEQHTLLHAALHKLDSLENRALRRRRKDFLSTRSPIPETAQTVEDFFPDQYYDFHEGHFDGVIKHFRETHVSSWGNADSPALSAVIDRLRTLYPSDSETQMHVLHLASDGEILPHVDNVGASGSWILGVSLGATRVLRLEDTDDAAPRAPFNLPLPSGSVYIQRDSIRYGYKHSILRAEDPSRGQRLSVMVRDILPKGANIPLAM